MDQKDFSTSQRVTAVPIQETLGRVWHRHGSRCSLHFSPFLTHFLVTKPPKPGSLLSGFPFPNSTQTSPRQRQTRWINTKRVPSGIERGLFFFFFGSSWKYFSLFSGARWAPTCIVWLWSCVRAVQVGCGAGCPAGLSEAAGLFACT